MDEAPPYPWSADRGAALAALLEQLVRALVAWTRPG